MTFPTTHPALSRALAARGYQTATAVQLAVLDEGAAGHDLLVSAQTGSGKTVAFGLAIATTLLGGDETLPPPSKPLALIIAPTRELALQVSRELSWLYEAAGAGVTTCVGGMDARSEARQLERGAHIVVGTPGRLRDHLERRRLDLTGLRAVVLDEADEMLDLGFREDLEFILDATPVERRTLLFSATLPRAIETLAGRYQRDAVRIQIGTRNEQHADIEYVAHRVAPHEVEYGVVNVLRYHEARAAIVFCATREAVGRLNASLLKRGFSSVALSGELTQAERTQALGSLRDGRARVLVATDVAARGLDLPDLDLVIHAEMPHDGETLLHRSGRTGRAGRKGLCVLIVPYHRRRKADTVIAAARLRVNWRPAPSASEIAARDKERFITGPAFTEAASDDELQLMRELQTARAADEIALALVRLSRAQLPTPTELAVDTGPPPRRAWTPRTVGEQTDRPLKPWQRRGMQETHAADAHGAPDAPGSDAAPAAAGSMAGGGHRDGRSPRPRRRESRPMTWFRINIGRVRNADPRWLLPLLCRAGGVTKSEVGAIRVDERETRFEILAEAADQFELHARTMKQTEGQIVRLSEQAVGGLAAAVEASEAIAQSAAPRVVETHTDGHSHDAGGKSSHRRQPWRGNAKSANAKSGAGKGRDLSDGRKHPHASGKGQYRGQGFDRGKTAGGWSTRKRPSNTPPVHGTQSATKPVDPTATRHPSHPGKKKKHRAPTPAADA